jgi:drug/metabolite transporter (DMT)-like permease
MVGKLLLPTLLTPVYDLIPSGNYRFLVSSVTIIFAGNYLFQHLYSSHPVLNAGVISVVTGVFTVNIGGLIIEHKFPNILMATGLMLVIVGATITVYARSQL